MREVISVYSLWRDSEPHIYRTLSQLEDLESLDYDFEYYFYENDSKDDTVNILKNWIQKRKGSFLHETLEAKKFGSVTDQERMHLLSDCRNKCKQLGFDSKSKYSLLIDSDIIFNKKNLQRSLSLIDDCVAVSPNVRQNIPDFVGERSETSYYDVFPFKDRFGSPGNHWDDCPFKNGIDRMNWFLGNPVESKSCFGGFFLTRSNIFKRIKWSTSGDSEHVNFCEELNFFGKILIDPQNKVYTKIDKSLVHMPSLKHMAKLQLQQV